MHCIRAMALMLLAVFPSVVFGQDFKKEPINGAGVSTMVVGLFVGEFNKKAASLGYLFAVPPESSKHAGAITNTEKHLFGRTGRPLNEKERKTGKVEIPLARVPIAFAVGSEVGISTLSLGQLERIYTGQVRNWKEVGGADSEIELLGREPTESLYSELKNTYPFFEKAVFQTICSNDTQVLNMLKSKAKARSMGFGSEIEFKAHNLSLVKIEGFSAAVSVGLVYDQRNAAHPVVSAAIQYARSKEWAALLTSKTSALPSR